MPLLLSFTPVYVFGASCPSGTTFNSSLGECTASPTCTYPTSYDSSVMTCTTTPSCFSGFYDSSLGGCVTTPSCPPGYTLSGGFCTDFVNGEFLFQSACPFGASYADGYCVSSLGEFCYYGSLSNGQCVVTPSCPSDTTFDPSAGLCVTPLIGATGVPEFPITSLSSLLLIALLLPALFLMGRKFRAIVRSPLV